MPNKKILLSITTNAGRETYLIPFAHSLITNTRNAPPNYDIEVHVFAGLSIDLVRTQAVLWALKNHFDALVFFDDDMTYPPDALSRLLARWEEGRPVVSGVYCSKAMPFHSFIYPIDGKNWLQQYTPNTIYPVKNIATGCLLVDMSVFTKIAKPWFLLSRDLNGYLAMTEDCHFGNLLHRCQIPMIVDTAIECGHLKLVSFPHFWDHPAHHYDGEFRPKKENTENLPETKGPIIIHPLEGSYIQDGLVKCCHLHQYPVPVNIGEKPLYQCLDCGLITPGENFGGINVVDEIHCSPADLQENLNNFDKDANDS